MRKLMWFGIGFSAVCAGGAYLLRGGALIWAAAVFCGLLLLSRAVRKPAVRMGAAALLLGAAVASVWFYGYDTMVVAPARALDQTRQSITLRVDSASWETERGSAVDGTVLLNDRGYKVRLYFQEPVSLIPGDQVSTQVKFRFTDLGGEKAPTFHRGNGILLLAYQNGAFSVTKGAGKLRDLPVILRERSLACIEQTLPESVSGFAKALLLSDRSDLDYTRSSQFSVAGISHIVAVSGLHVSILFALIYWAAGKRRYLTALLGIPVLVLFAAMAGCVPSVVRASLMQILAILALALDREYDPPTALGAAVLLMLMRQPLQITSVGFQLSVASVAGIFLFYRRIHEWLMGIRLGKRGVARFWRRLMAGVSLTVSATILTIPLVAVYFGTISLTAVLTNLLVLPVVSLIFYGTALIGLIGGILPSVGGVLGAVVTILIRYVYGVSRLLSGFPLAAVYTKSVYVMLWIVLCYGVFLLLLRSGGARPLASLMVCTAALAAALGLSYAQIRMDDYRVTALDVGQGACTLLQCNGATYMVDCGGDHGEDAADQAAQTLFSQGIFRLDGLILTHYDEDHVGGVEALAQRMKIGTLYLPDTDGIEGFRRRIEGLEGIGEICPVGEDMTCPIGKGRITIFAPGIGHSDNDRGIAVLFQRENYDTLITGDLTTAQELRLVYEKDLPDCEVLVVGHHGSNGSTSDRLLEAIAPDIAMISVGAENAYGHPGSKTLSRLEYWGCRILRTDQMGDITYRR